VLNPERYLSKTIEMIENGIEFGNVIKSITRGAPLSGADLDRMVSTEPTDNQYLMLSNIKNGLIDENLPYLKEIDKKYEKYYINDKNIVMSKNGYPFKVSVFEKQGNRRVLANGNLFVIEIDETKANPYYIKAFLDSEAGISALKSITVGSTIPSIGLESLKKIIIPSISLEEQQVIVNKYLAKKDEIEYLKKQLTKAIDSLNHILD
jgi:type I restriction enzyme M protein